MVQKSLLITIAVGFFVVASLLAVVLFGSQMAKREEVLQPAPHEQPTTLGPLTPGDTIEEIQTDLNNLNNVNLQEFEKELQDLEAEAGQL